MNYWTTIAAAFTLQASVSSQTLYVGSAFIPIARIDDLNGQAHPVFVAGPQSIDELAIDPFTGDLVASIGSAVQYYRWSAVAIDSFNLSSAFTRAMDFDAEGDLWMRTAAPERLVEVDRLDRHSATDIPTPSGVAADLAIGVDGRVYTAKLNGEIDVYDPVTRTWSILGSHGFGDQVRGFEIDANGVGYIATWTGSLHRFDLSSMTSQLIVDLATFGINIIHGMALAEPATTGFTWGSGYCSMGNLNSVVSYARIGGGESGFAAANNLQLRVFNTAPFTAGYFLVSRTQGFVPHVGWSEGNLCLGGAIGRFTGPGQILTSTPWYASTIGRFEFSVDLAAIPTPQGTVAGIPGDTWNFQLWYRDSSSGGATLSNFSDALSIVLR